MHSRIIRDKIIEAISKGNTPEEQSKLIKLAFLDIIGRNDKAIGSLRKVLNRLFPEYKELLEKILILK